MNLIRNGVSAIVPTIGRAESLARLLQSLAAQTRRPDEVVVADGGDGDAVREVVERPMWVSLGLNVRRIGVHPPHAVRQRVAAIADARGEFLLLLDDDVVLEPNCVEQLFTAVTGDVRVAGAMADFNNQTWPAPTAAWRFYLKSVLRLREGAWQGQVIGPLLRFGYNPSPPSAMPMAWLGTCNTLIRRSAYEQAGGFSDFFLHRCTINEDVDLGLKIARVGTILLCPSARLGHFHAPGGRVAVAVAAEDDLYNRYLIMRRTQGRTAGSAFGLLVLYFAIESASNLIGCLRRFRTNDIGGRMAGQIKAFGRILAGHEKGRQA